MCGKKQVTVTIGNQSVVYDYEYQPPKLSSCNVSTTTNLIECQGYFTEFKSYYSNNEIDIQISNSKIQNGGAISIFSTEFYEKIDQITIGNRPCFQQLFRDDKTISCTLIGYTSEEKDEEPFLPLVYVNVTISGNSKGTYLSIYLDPRSTSDEGGIGFYTGHFKWMIVGLPIYRVRTEILWCQKKAHQEELNKEFDDGPTK